MQHEKVMEIFLGAFLEYLWIFSLDLITSSVLCILTTSPLYRKCCGARVQKLEQIHTFLFCCKQKSCARRRWSQLPRQRAMPSSGCLMGGQLICRCLR
jgi:hypothetical protein